MAGAPGDLGSKGRNLEARDGVDCKGDITCCLHMVTGQREDIKVDPGVTLAWIYKVLIHLEGRSLDREGPEMVGCLESCLDLRTLGTEACSA